MRAFLCWAPERGETREGATEIETLEIMGDREAAEGFAAGLHSVDPMAEDESVLVHVIGPFNPGWPPPADWVPSVWRVVVVVETHLRARPA